MKNTLLFLCCLLFLPLTAQIVFEEVTPPDDFSLRNILKSPTGAYYTQADNNASRLYSAMDGENWTAQELSSSIPLYQMQFYSDGVPILFDAYSYVFIPGDEAWQRLHTDAGWSPARAAHIKDDTLFAYRNNAFSFSVDRGESFFPLFTFDGDINENKSSIWVTDQYLILTHAAGATELVAVFSRDGQNVRNDSLDFGFPRFTFNRECSTLMIYDDDFYYLLSGATLEATTGSLDDLLPVSNDVRSIQAVNDHWYLHQGNTLWKTSDCSFDWAMVIEDALLESSGIGRIAETGDLLLAGFYEDKYLELPVGDTQFTERAFDIDYALISRLDESPQFNYAVSTPNHLFTKTIDQDLTESMSYDHFLNAPIAYAPGGNLYVLSSQNILFSADNGQSYTSISAPGGAEVEELEVLADDLLFIELSDTRQRFYSLNNGQEWIPIGLSPAIYGSKAVLVGDELVVLNLDAGKEMTKVNLVTQEVVADAIEDYDVLFDHHMAFHPDGNIFFYKDSYDIEYAGLYRYSAESGTTYLGNFPEFNFSKGFLLAGNDLYVFQPEKYYIYNGGVATEYPYVGLPANSVVQFTQTTSHHLYAIVGEHHVYRSTLPLRFPQTVSGTLYFDENEDCVPDDSDALIEHWQVRLEGDNLLRIRPTNSTGQFSFSVPTGEYTLSVQPASANWGLCESTVELMVTEEQALYTQDFRAQALVECAELELDFSTPLLRRCFDNYYSIRVRNVGPVASAGTVLQLELDPYFEFLSADLPNTQLSDTDFEFDLGVLERNEEVVFRIYFNLSCEAELGQEHCLNGTLRDANLCPDAISTYQECQENIGSYDPNDKRVFNQNGQATSTVDLQEYIYYHIRFQNTGTDTAFQVRVVDPLSAKLDIGTLEMLSASHAYTYEITDGPSLVVTFDDILLPDSTTNEVASHGFFRFKIKPLPEFGYGTEILNEAGIYFDFNEPIITNEAALTIQEPVRVRTPLELLDIQVYPNPTRQNLSVILPQTRGYFPDTFEIINPMGQKILQGRYYLNAEIDVAELPAGAYQILLRNKGSLIGTAMFVKAL